MTGDGVGTLTIMREVGCAKATVWRWQERFAAEGVDGLLRDKSRPPGKTPLARTVVERVIERTLGEPPGEATHWSGRAMAEAAGISLRSVQRIWAAHGLQPHRVKRFKLSKDPEFAAKLQDIVGLYVDPPAHAVVLSVDEKSQIQALDRTQPGLPWRGRRPSRATAGRAMAGSRPWATAMSRSTSAPAGATRRSACGDPPVFGLAKRWLLGTHQGSVWTKHLPAYLDEFVFRFNRRTANNLSHRFARVIQQAIRTRPSPTTPSSRRPLLNVVVS